MEDWGLWKPHQRHYIGYANYTVDIVNEDTEEHNKWCIRSAIGHVKKRYYAANKISDYQKLKMIRNLTCLERVLEVHLNTTLTKDAAPSQHQAAQSGRIRENSVMKKINLEQDAIKLMIPHHQQDI